MLLDASEKARTVERMLEGDRDRTELDIVDTVESYVADEASAAVPENTFELELTSSLRVEDHWALPVAIENVVENAAEHNDSDDPHVWVEVTETGPGPDAPAGEAGSGPDGADAEGDSGTVTVEVRDDGPGIPEQDRNVIEEGRETDLEHGSGLGLWVVYWIVDSAGGDLAFGERDPRGAVVRMTFDRLPPAEAEEETGDAGGSGDAGE